jgi:hypothetical protein
LTRNPFPSSTIPEDIPLITVDRESEIRHFKDVIGRLYQDGGSTTTVLVGDYGSGKSHLMRIFKNSVNAQLLQSDEPCLAVYVRSTGRNFSDFFFAFVDDVGKSFLSELSKKTILDYFSKNWSRAQRHIFDKDLRKKFDPKSGNLDEILRSSTILDLVTEIRDEHFEGIKDKDIISAFLFLAHPDFSSLAWRWFLGESLSKDERNEILVDSPIADKKESYSAFQSFIGLLRRASIKSVVLLVDELEKIVLIPSIQRSQYQDDLRHLIDDNPKWMAIFFAIAPNQWNQLSSEPTAFQRRLAGNIHQLDNFDEGRIRDLLHEHLLRSRISDFSEADLSSTFPECEPALCPFTDDSVSVISSVTRGKVSDVLLLSRKALDFFMDHLSSYRAITKELVTTMARQEGF